MKSVPASVAAAVLVSLVACDRPDAKPGVRLVSTSPADGASRVGVHESIVLTFSGPLDPASIHGDTVKFRPPGAVDYRNPKLSYDPNTYTVTVTPRQPMDWGDQQVVVMGLKDPYGDSVLRTKVSFRTWLNPVTEYVEYDAGAVRGRWQFVNDEDGRQIREMASLQGNDWYWRSSTYDQRGMLTRYVTYDPGPDGKSDTSDDVVIRHDEYKYDDLGNLTGYTVYDRAGQVLEYGTTDYDQFGNATHGTAEQGTPSGYWWLATYDVFGNQTGYYTATSRGFDGTLGTADDASPSAWRTEWDGRGYLLAYTRLTDPGPDAVWLTADDVTAERYAYTYDASGNRSRYDGGSWCEEFLYDAAGNMTHDLWYGPGPDKKCFSGDETGLFKSGFQYDYDEFGRETRAVNYALGSRTGYANTSYGANGNRVAEVRYSGPGADTEWFTEDDTRWLEYRYDPAK
jgi:hypothetical protein